MTDENENMVRQEIMVEFTKEDIENGRIPGVLLTQYTPCAHPECVEAAAKFAISAGPSPSLKGAYACVLIGPGGNFIEMSIHDSFEGAIDSGMGVLTQSLINLGYTMDRVVITKDGWEVLE